MQGKALYLFGRFDGRFMRSEACSLRDRGLVASEPGSSKGPVGNSEYPFSCLRDPFTGSEGPPHVLRGPGHALSGTSVPLVEVGQVGKRGIFGSQRGPADSGPLVDWVAPTLENPFRCHYLES